MSPYRVVTQDKSGNIFIHVAIMSNKPVDTCSGRRTIYILNKPIPMTDDGHPACLADIAYKMNTKLNSSIVDKYYMFKTARSKYRVVDPSFSPRVVSLAEKIQSNCLIAAMNDYCQYQQLDIIQVL